MSDTLPKQTPSSSCDLTHELQESHEQILKPVWEELKTNRSQHVKCKLLYEAVEDAIKPENTSNSLDEALKTRVTDILLAARCAPGLTLQTTPILGITSNDVTALNYTEGEKLQSAVQLALQDKYKKLCDEFFEITGRNINEALEKGESTRPDGLSREERYMLDLKEQLSQEQQLYLKHLQELQKKLEDMLNFKLEKVPSICINKMQELQVKTELNSLKTKVLHQNTRKNIFMETDESLSGYDEIIKGIQDQQDECRLEIQELKELKIRYEKVKSKQFDEMVKTYKHYKAAIEKRKMIMEALKR